MAYATYWLFLVRPLARDLRVLISWPFPLGFGLDGRLLLAWCGRVCVQFIIIIIITNLLAFLLLETFLPQTEECRPGRCERAGRFRAHGRKAWRHFGILASRSSASGLVTAVDSTMLVSSSRPPAPGNRLSLPWEPCLPPLPPQKEVVGGRFSVRAPSCGALSPTCATFCSVRGSCLSEKPRPTAHGAHVPPSADLARLCCGPTQDALLPTPSAGTRPHQHRDRSAARALKGSGKRVRIPWRAGSALIAPWSIDRPPTEHARRAVRTWRICVVG